MSTKVVYRALSPYGYALKLSRGYLPYLPFADRNDAQYNGLISNILTITAVAVAYVLGSTLFARVFNVTKAGIGTFLSVLFIIALYGGGAINVLALILANYLIPAFLWKWPMVCKGITWAVWVALLCTNEKTRAYKFSDVSPYLSALDKWKGHGNRWYMSLGFLCLRAISYNVDRVNYIHKLDKNTERYHNTKCGCMSSKSKDSYPAYACRSGRILGAHGCDYNFLSYLSYMCYAPLFLCGPVITYNDYTYQIKHNKHRKFPFKETVVYVLHSLMLAFLMELSLHMAHFSAIYSTRAWAILEPRHICAVISANFIGVWLKLSVIWRYFRLWAVFDNIFTVENTGYPQFSLYSITQVWRQWHRSFNRWCLRYLYIPLGGSKYVYFNIWIVFSFVGLWHNFQDYVLQFGWINCSLVVLEILSIWSRSLNSKKYPVGVRYIMSLLCEIPAVTFALICWIAGIAAYFIGVSDTKLLLRTYFSQNHLFTTLIFILWLANFFQFSKLWPLMIFSTTYPSSEN